MEPIEQAFKNFQSEVVKEFALINGCLETLSKSIDGMIDVQNAIIKKLP